MPSDGSTKIDGLERLAKLAETGRISEDEYVQLKSELIASDPSPDAFEEAASAPIETPPHAEVQETRQPAPPTPGIYHGALWMGIASIFLGSTFGLVSWATIGLSIYALTTTTAKHSRWMPWTGLVLGVTYGYINLYLNGYISGV